MWHMDGCEGLLYTIYNLAKPESNNCFTPTLLTANLICMFILHNVAKNCVKSKRDKWGGKGRERRTVSPLKKLDEAGLYFLFLYKYFLMTLQPKFDLNVHVTQKEREREMEREPPGQKVENKFHAKQRGFSVSRHRFAYEIWAAQREYQGVKPTIEGWLQQLQMAAQLKRFLCIFHVSNRASINRCLCTHVRERLQPTSVASSAPHRG